MSRRTAGTFATELQGEYSIVIRFDPDRPFVVAEDLGGFFRQDSFKFATIVFGLLGATQATPQSGLAHLLAQNFDDLGKALRESSDRESFW